MSKILIIAAPGFEETETVVPCDIWRRLKFEVTLAGLDDMQIIGAHGIVIESDALLDEVKELEYDALFLPGGMPGSVNLRDDERVCTLVKKMAQQGKVVSAVCAAPMVLSKCGILNGKRFTMYPGMNTFLSGSDVPQTDLVAVDGNIVTGKGPGAVFEFAAAVASVLGCDVGKCYASMMMER